MNMPDVQGYYWVKLDFPLKDGRRAETWTIACWSSYGAWYVTGDGSPVVPSAVIEIGPKVEPPNTEIAL